MVNMKFEWEYIDEDTYDGGIQSITLRAKVKGGWLVLINNFVLSTNPIDESTCCDCFDSSMAFVPDLKHEWVIE
jgi:hypothetical protein